MIILYFLSKVNDVVNYHYDNQKKHGSTYYTPVKKTFTSYKSLFNISGTNCAPPQDLKIY